MPSPEFLIEYFGELRDRPVYRHTSSGEIRSGLDSRLPIKGTDFDSLLKSFATRSFRLAVRTRIRACLAYVQSPGTPIGAFADLLASTLNANLTIWRSAPGPVELERLTIDWIRQILGFPAEAGGLFVSGGSMANLAALAAARQTNTTRWSPAPLCVQGGTFLDREGRSTFGNRPGECSDVGIDERFRMRVDDFVAKINADVEAGYVPFCVVGNAGTVDTGAVDPLHEIREVANRYHLWMHVDGSYGAFAILADSRKLFAGMEEADSIALDPHKWLYLPVDVGCVIYRDPEAAHATFAHEAEYTRMFGEEADEAFVCWDYGPELSRRFRALKVWMLLKGVGLDRLSEAIESNLACARHLESMVQASDDFEMVAPVELSIFCFRHVPVQLRNQSPEVIDAFNEQLLVALQRDGSSYLSNTTLGGRFALRGCVLNYRTTLRDMEILLDDLRRVAKSLPTSL